MSARAKGRLEVAQWHLFVGSGAAPQNCHKESKMSVSGVAKHDAQQSRSLSRLQRLINTTVAPSAALKAVRGVRAGVRVSFLRSLAAVLDRTLSTNDVVESIIVPTTAKWTCRFVALLPPDAIADATIFVSHTWQGKFADMIAALTYALDDHVAVWIDIFAVLQHCHGLDNAALSEKHADLDFASVVTGTKALLLVSPHVPEVAALRFRDVRWLEFLGPTVLSQLHVGIQVREGRIPPESRKAAQHRCPFFRVWCLTELVTAAMAELPVVMLVGTADSDHRFVPDPRMLNMLFHVINVADATASIEADRDRVLAVVRAAPGLDAANSLCRGAVQGAIVAMGQLAVLKAALGSSCMLSKMSGKYALGSALCGAAAGGFVGPVTELLERVDEVDLEVRDKEHKNTPLSNAASGGHVNVCRLLIAAGAELDARNRYHQTPIMEAASGGHDGVIEVLAAAGADVNATNKQGTTALMNAARSGKVPSVAALVACGADASAKNKDGRTALDLARIAASSNTSISGTVFEKIELALATEY